MAQQMNASHTQAESVPQMTEERRDEAQAHTHAEDDEEEVPLPPQVEQFKQHEDYQLRTFYANHIARLMRTKARLLTAQDLADLSRLIELMLRNK